MLDEPLKKIDEIFLELKERYARDQEFYENMKDNSEILKNMRATENLDPNVRLLASIAVGSETRLRLVYNTYLSTLNVLIRLLLMTKFSIITIANELSQLKQQPSTPLIEANIEKISKVEEDLIKLNKEFKKYSPTLKKFKRALDHTEKTLRDNR